MSIKIVSVGRVEKEVLEYLAFVLPDKFDVDFRTLKTEIDPREAYIARRSQYDSTKVLSQLLSLNCDDENKILGVTNVDLCVPIFTFVFGAAQVGASAALISTCRLRQQFYGLPEDKNLFLVRCEKEAVHELGHAHGLVHCESYDCAMHFSNSIEQVDLKNASFCKQCMYELQRRVTTTSFASNHWSS